MSTLFIDTLFQKPSSQTPVWMMRQAGRYLPEYREIRKSFSQFLEFCYTPEAACEVTIQPITRFGMDAAILFSDILVIPDAMGQKVWFEAGEGPKLDAIKESSAIHALRIDTVEEKLDPVFHAIKLIKKALPSTTPLIGFSGAPWTLACYMIEGQGSKEFQETRKFSYEKTKDFQLLIDKLTDAIITYARIQIDSGIQAFQLFDSWSGVLPEHEFSRWVIEPTKKIVQAIKNTHPQIPIIGFARGAGIKLGEYVYKTHIDALGVDTSMPLSSVISEHAHGKTTQGNLDPVLLASDRLKAIEQTKQILKYTKHTPHIFNLGHGILPHTPIDHVKAVIETVREAQK